MRNFVSMTVNLYVCLTVCMPICQSVCLSNHQSIMSIHQSVNSSICQSFCLSICLSFHISACSPVCQVSILLPDHWSVSPNLQQSVCLSSSPFTYQSIFLSICLPVYFLFVLVHINPYMTIYPSTVTILYISCCMFSKMR